MNLLRKLFSKKKDSEKMLAKINVSQYFNRFKYKEYYFKFTYDVENKNRAISELYIFRCWIIQFAFRIYSSKPDISELLIEEIFQLTVVNSFVLKTTENVDLEVETKLGVLDLIDSRWQEYDEVFILYKKSHEFQQINALTSKLLDFCNIKEDTMKSIWLSSDFEVQLDEIKKNAIESGLLD